jgi:hypothetical protein
MSIAPCTDCTPYQLCRRHGGPTCFSPGTAPSLHAPNLPKQTNPVGDHIPGTAANVLTAVYANTGDAVTGERL